MLIVGLISTVEELVWISPVVIQDKKVGEGIHVCVDFNGMNATFVHDPFYNDEPKWFICVIPLKFSLIFTLLLLQFLLFLWK
jgi:hypothetical protein